MNRPKNIVNKLFLAIAVLAALPLIQSCIADDLSGCPNPDGPTMHVGKKAVHYLAFNLMSADGGALDTNWDSEFGKPDHADEYGWPFDKGTVAETALYFPEKPDEDTEETPSEGDNEDKPEGVDENGDASGDGDEGEGGEEGEEGDDDDGDEEEENTKKQLYHFAVVFKEDGSRISDGLVPLEFEYSNNDTDDVTVYGKVYSSEEDNPFKEGDDLTVLVVLNASWDIQQKAQDKLKLDKSSKENFNEFRKLKVEGTVSDVDAFLYLKDEKGKYIVDDDNNRYLTMTSSMIIKDNNGSKVVRPAIQGYKGGDPVKEDPAFTLYKTENEAKEKPTKIYVERLAAKYTVVFRKEDNNYYYLKPLNQNSNIAETASYSTRGTEETGTSTDPIGTDHLLIKVDNPIYQLKYVAEYERKGSDVTQRGKPEIRTTQEWWANILGWDINANERGQNLFKVITPNTTYYDNWDKWVKDTKNEFSYRNYWAEDLNYNEKGNYPWQYRDIYSYFEFLTDPENHEYLYENPNGDHSLETIERIGPPSTLDYYNFSNLLSRNIRRYMVENTFNQNLLNQQGQDPYHDAVYLRTGSHLIVGAQLIIKELDPPILTSTWPYDDTGLLTGVGSDRAKSKYYMNDIYWAEIAYKNYVAEYLGYFMMDEDEQKANFGRNDGVIYVIKDGEKKPASADDFDFGHAHIEGGDNLVYITPKEGVVLYTFNPEEEEPTEEENPEEPEEPGTDDGEDTNKYEVPEGPDDQDPIVIEEEGNEIPFGLHEIPMDKYLNLVYAHPELMAACYNEGRMYYVSGTIHNQESLDKGLYQIYTGDYGTVRNNWYSFKIGRISAPGTAVDLPDQPIVPNGNDHKAVAVGVSVQEWHNKYTSVDPSGQNRPGQTKPSSGN